MKKVIFSLMMCGLMSTSLISCQDENDAPVPVAQETIESTFPEGTRTTTVKVNVAQEERTRTTFDLPLWETFSTESGELDVRFAVYNADGTIFYQTPKPIKVTDTTFDLTIPKPSGTCSLFVWADKSSGWYALDFTNKCVGYQGNGINTRTDMSRAGDAWCAWETNVNFNNPVSLTLTRPFMQVNVLSDEFSIPGVADKYKNGIYTLVGFTDGTSSVAYYPTKWYWEDSSLEFSSMSTNLSQYFFANERSNVYYGTIDGRKMEYLASAYFFGAAGSGNAVNNFKDKKTGKTYPNIQIAIYNNAQGGSAVVRTIENMSTFECRNIRITAYNKTEPGTTNPDSGTDGGLINSTANIGVDISDGYSVTIGK